MSLSSPPALTFSNCLIWMINNKPRRKALCGSMVTGAGMNLSMKTSNEVVIKSSYFVMELQLLRLRWWFPREETTVRLNFKFLWDTEIIQLMIMTPTGNIRPSVWFVVRSLFLLALGNESSMGDGHCYRVPLIHFHPCVDFLLISELKQTYLNSVPAKWTLMFVLMFLKNAELFPSLRISSHCLVKPFISEHLQALCPGPCCTTVQKQ